MTNPIVAGSPIIPPKFIFEVAIFAIVVLAVMSLVVWKKYQYLSAARRMKKLLEVGFFTVVFLACGLVSLSAYWLLPTPNLVRSSILAKEQVSPVEPIVFQFDKPVSRQRLEKIMVPEVPGTWIFEQPLYGTHLTRRLVFYPQVSLKPDTEYKIQLSGITNTSGFSRTKVQDFGFRTRKSAEVKSISVSEGETDRSNTDPIKVELTEANEGDVDFTFIFEPETKFEAKLNPDKRGYTISFSEPLEKKMAYLLNVKRSVLTKDLELDEVISREEPKTVKFVHFATGGILSAEETFQREHPTYGAVTVIHTTPKAGASGVSLSAPISVTFSQAVNHSSAEQAFTISPATAGAFEWAADTMTFKPKELKANTKYSVTLSSGIRGVVGKPSDQVFSFTFISVSPVTKLGVPAYLQQHALSCEVSTLRMALAYRGVTVTENQLMSELGVDNTPHVGDIWGDPNEKFVGNVDGRQMVDGYGVHWGPIARIGAKYRNTQAFENWTISQLLEQVKNGNPVVVWLFSNKGISTTWHTPSGKQINAVRDEHTALVVGYTGSPDNPSQIIVNDPLIGQVYWSKSWFEKKWGIFNGSGVVVY